MSVKTYADLIDEMKMLAKKIESYYDSVTLETEVPIEDEITRILREAGIVEDDEELEEKKTKQRLDPKCWDGYKKDGTKMKGGVRVNNCVPESVEKDDEDEADWLEPDLKKRHDNNEKARKDMEKMGSKMKNPHLGEEIEEGIGQLKNAKKDTEAMRKAAGYEVDKQTTTKTKDGGTLRKTTYKKITDSASKDEEDEFHRELDKLVHKTFGKSSDEKKMKEAIGAEPMDILDVDSGDHVNINGTSRRGGIKTSFEELRRIFGEPTRSTEMGDDLDKTNAEWHLEFEVRDEDDADDSEFVVATIYDWKYPSLPQGVVDWEVGGHTWKSYEAVVSYMDSHKANESADDTVARIKHLAGI